MMIKCYFVCFYGIYLKYFFIEINLFVIFKINNYMINLEINISRFLCNFSIDYVVRVLLLVKDFFVFVVFLFVYYVIISVKMW